MYAGIDIGSLTAKLVVVNQKGKIIARELMAVLPNPLDSAQELIRRISERNKIKWQEIKYVVSTGYGREKIQEQGWAQENISEISCHGFGAFHLNPKVRTIIDIGGQDSKAIKINKNGELENFVMNDKCAAGTGHFLEVMARVLEVELGELGTISKKSRRPVEISSRCTIYAETEVIHSLQQGTPKVDIAAGINQAMAERVLTLVRRVGAEKEIMITGGVAKNQAVKRELEKALGSKIIYPRIDPQLIGAYGAALFALRQGEEK